MTTRRSLITNAVAFLAAPAIVRASSLMPVRAWRSTQDELVALLNAEMQKNMWLNAEMQKSMLDMLKINESISPRTITHAELNAWAEANPPNFTFANH